jgi:hypothetical protein
MGGSGEALGHRMAIDNQDAHKRLPYPQCQIIAG